MNVEYAKRRILREGETPVEGVSGSLEMGG